MITPGTATAVAYLIAELAAAGVSIDSIMAEARATGKVPPEKWAEIMAEIEAAEELWESV